MRAVRPLLAMFVLVLAACGPDAGPQNADCPGADLQTDIQNCGHCGNACAAGETCQLGSCTSECEPGATLDCYDGPPNSDGVGPCHGGQRICQPSGTWGQCSGQVLPSQEVCANGIDENCSGTVDEDQDADGDGFTTCQGDCCDSGECGQPELVNPGAFDAIGNELDDDCDGQIDNPQTACDIGLPSSPTDMIDYARAMDLCPVVTEESRHWGVISAALTLASGTGAPGAGSHSIRPMFGSGLLPQSGLAFALFSSGTAASPGQTNPSHVNFTASQNWNTSSPFPADWLAAHAGVLPNSPGCPAVAAGTAAQDPVMLTLRVRAPSNAKSFSFATNFYSAEFPEWVCSPYNDFFVVLLDSAWSGTPANPADKNLAFYRHPTSMAVYPVGVNLGHGNTGLFTQCLNGGTGCAPGSTPGTISTCSGIGQLAGTGFDQSAPFDCEAGSVEGGATGWLQTSGNVVGGEIFTLRIAIWDTSDHVFDSLVVIDNFQWSVDASDPGTIPD